MGPLSKPDLIFKQWIATLPTRDKSKNAISGNFEELFWALRGESLTLEDAYPYLEKAIKAHQPSIALIRNVYKRMKASGTAFMQEKEFGEVWCQDIADKGNAAFFLAFPVETKMEVENEPPIHGTMTAKEYRMQREHADSFPQLNLEEIEKRIASYDYNPLDDLSNLIGKNGDSN